MSYMYISIESNEYCTFLLWVEEYRMNYIKSKQKVQVIFSKTKEGTFAPLTSLHLNHSSLGNQKPRASLSESSLTGLLPVEEKELDGDFEMARRCPKSWEYKCSCVSSCPERRTKKNITSIAFISSSDPRQSHRFFQPLVLRGLQLQHTQQSHSIAPVTNLGTAQLQNMPWLHVFGSWLFFVESRDGSKDRIFPEMTKTMSYCI